MTTQQIIAALATTEAAQKEGTPLNIIVHLAQTGSGPTRMAATRDCLEVWRKLGGSESEDEVHARMTNAYMGGW